MSILKVFSEAATGAFSPQSVSPVSRTPKTAPNREVPERKAEEDAATVTLSTAAKEFAAGLSDVKSDNASVGVSSEVGKGALEQTSDASSSDINGDAQSEQEQSSSNDSQSGLSEDEKREVAELKARDREVRAHEQAHLSALGGHRQGGASFQFQTGPDGKQYAVGGEVPVDVSPGATPSETIQKAQTIRRAALAPSEPSSADRAVAAKTSQLEAQARADLQAAGEGAGESEAAEVESSEGSEKSPAYGEKAAISKDDENTFYSGRLVGSSQRAFEQSLQFAAASNERGALLNLSA